jgi:hypothetical protein
MKRSRISDAARLEFLANLVEVKRGPELAADLRRAIARLRGTGAVRMTPPAAATGPRRVPPRR